MNRKSICRAEDEDISMFGEISPAREVINS